MDILFSSPIVPLAVGFIFLAIAGYIELRTYVVPNVLTFSAIALAIGYSILAAAICPGGSGNLASVFVGLIISSMMLIPIYAKGGIGAGCVKAQAAAGAWFGAALPLAACVKFVFFSSLGALAVVTIYWAFCVRQQAISKDGGVPANASPLSVHVHGQFPLSIGTMLGALTSSWI